MSNENGPHTVRPETDAAPDQGDNGAQTTAHDSPQANPPEAHEAEVLSGGAPEAAVEGGPETKEKNKIFESVRLKARLSMAEQELEKLRAEIDKLKSAPAEYMDKNMRLMADMENLRRRTEREKADTSKFAITRFARDVLTVADNFQRAVDAVPKDEVAADGPLKTLFEGVDLIGRELLTTLERHGVKRIDPTGTRFDPNVHQAMMQVENAEVANGTVLQAFQPAYMIEDRVLRPAMVVVSTGGPKTPKPVEPTADEAPPPSPNPDEPTF
jgi:molecular chaperone GrpE